jgi:hypothetical protein
VDKLKRAKQQLNQQSKTEQKEKIADVFFVGLKK